MNWAVYALLSALFGGITAVLAKVGVQGVPSNLAMVVRTLVVVVFTVALVIISGEVRQVHQLTSRNWTFLVLSGIATGLSWICYFAALSHGPVSRVAPIDKLSFVLAMLLGFILLGESAKPTTVAGAGLIVAGVLLTLK